MTIASTIGQFIQNKIDNTQKEVNNLKITKTPKSNPTISSNSGNDNDGPVAFSIEPYTDLDTVMSLLNSNLILHICILYLLVALLILYISTMVIENKWNLMFIKNIFGERFYNLLIKSLSLSGKNNKIWMFIGWLFLIFASIVALYLSFFLLNYIDIISNIVEQSKNK